MAITNAYVDFEPNRAQTSPRAVLHAQWNFHTTKVSLVEYPQGLETIFEDEWGKTSQSKVEKSDSYSSMDDHIAHLKTCEPVVIDGVPHFIVPLKRWKLENGEVCLLRKEQELIYVMIDLNQERLHGPIPYPPDVNIEDCINYLLSCYPLIKEGDVRFLSPYFTWDWKEYRIKLLTADSSLFSRTEYTKHDSVWQIANTLSEETLHVPFEQAAVVHASTTIPITKCKLCHIKELEVTNLEIQKNTGFVHLKCVDLRSHNGFPIHAGLWAVTLLNTGKTDITNPKTWYGHAGILIEGVESGAYVSYFAHLTAEDGGKVKLKKGIIPTYSGQSETFPIESEHVRKMLQIVEYEMAQQEKGEPIVFFSTGKVSPLLSQMEAFYKKDEAHESLTCRTIRTFDTYESMIHSILNCELSTFEEVIWDHRDDDVLVRLMRLAYASEYPNQAEALYFMNLDIEEDKEKFTRKKEIEREIQQITEEPEKKKVTTDTEHQPYCQIYFLDMEKDQVWIESNDPTKRDRTREVVANRVISSGCRTRFIVKKDNGTWEEIVQLHNCMSWASGMLAIIGIYLHTSSDEWKPSDLVKMDNSHQGQIETSKLKNTKLGAPFTIRKKALQLEEHYLETLQLNKEYHKPKLTLDALLPEPNQIDMYTLLWLVNLHDTPGITGDIHIFLQKFDNISTVTTALTWALGHLLMKEVDVLVDYFCEKIQSFPIDKEGNTPIDFALQAHLKTNKHERACIEFLTILRSHEIQFLKTRIFNDFDFTLRFLTTCHEKNYTKLLGVIRQLSGHIGLGNVARLQKAHNKQTDTCCAVQ